MDATTLAGVERVFRVLGARLEVRAQWQGADLDHLLDGQHAALVEAMVVSLERTGWDARPEVTFSVFGERGAHDILASHRATGRVVHHRGQDPDWRRAGHISWAGSEGTPCAPGRP